MPQVKPDKMHVTHMPGTSEFAPRTPRCYTLTHSDLNGDIFLSIGCSHDTKETSKLYTRFMRDEVIAELRNEDNQPSMNLHYHVSGGFAFGWAKLRYKIFCHYITYNLQAIRLGDRAFLDANPEFDNAKIAIHFHSTNKKYDKTEQRGVLADYRL